jgi:hypothetical protein
MPTMTEKRGDTTGPSPLRQQLVEELSAMTGHALSSGLKVAPALVRQVEAMRRDPDANLEEMAKAHGQLVELVAPATPRLLVALSGDSARTVLSRWLGRIPMTRRMMVSALISLGAFIGLSLSPAVHSPNEGNLFATSGVPLLINELFLLAAAALGASFAGLSQLSRDVALGKFDPQHQAQYWSNFIHGLIAGLILATVISFNFTPEDLPGNGEHTVVRLTAAALALLGGFSSSVVHRILNRMVESLETMVRGNPEDAEHASWQVAKAHLDQQLVQERLKLASTLLALQRQLVSGRDAAAVLAQLDALVKSLLPEDTAPPASSSSAPREKTDPAQASEGTG